MEVFWTVIKVVMIASGVLELASMTDEPPPEPPETAERGTTSEPGVVLDCGFVTGIAVGGCCGAEDHGGCGDLVLDQ